ncbi:Gx transporter family protein [Methylotenera mobilis]|uniref:Heptaprenyl diphosphate synthase component I n=1 Tax=Methylotenera mobilis (strain JLW8 / ATCC BAA-1282 / DSM 17540) TaxID=583345 RepID=C6WTA7_METML|nr:Gx transporter family protein [Methylotenera mobilis]ACT49169.1 Heptaprenyl diphosphate synthase component I [Methylotenera mobilis JLW8]
MLIKTTIEDHRIAKLAAVAIALHMLEAVIPSPLPGVKPGIANIVTLYVLLKYGFASAAWVSMLRVFASSLLLGQFLSPTFILSLAGAMLSLGVLRLCMYLPKKHFGTVSLSILAAFAHIAGQLIIVRLWLIPHASVAYLVPVFAMAALFFGLINGVIANKLLYNETSTIDTASKNNQH